MYYEMLLQKLSLLTLFSLEKIYIFFFFKVEGIREDREVLLEKYISEINC